MILYNKVLQTKYGELDTVITKTKFLFFSRIKIEQKLPYADVDSDERKIAVDAIARHEYLKAKQWLKTNQIKY